jgi:hypothetical protein
VCCPMPAGFSPDPFCASPYCRNCSITWAPDCSILGRSSFHARANLSRIARNLGVHNVVRREVCPSEERLPSASSTRTWAIRRCLWMLARRVCRRDPDPAVLRDPLSRAQNAHSILGTSSVLEGLAFHNVAPVAGGVTNGEEYRASLCGLFTRFIAPRIPIHGIVGVLQQVRTFR